VPVRSPTFPPPARRLGRRHAGLHQLGLFALAYSVYFGVRALTQGSAQEAARNALHLIHFEEGLGIAWEGTVQRAALGSELVVKGANAVYMYGHWPVIIVAGVLLFLRRRDQYFRLRDACLLSGLVGLVIFGLFPVAPPRLTDLPLVDTVTRDDAGYRQLVPPSLVNEYAAMPSFHAGWNLLVGIAVFSATRNPVLRALAVIGPAAMIVAVVVTANHFVVDVVAGVAIALGCLLLRDLLVARANRRPTMDPSVRKRTQHVSSRAVPHRAPGGERPERARGGAHPSHSAH
jgi:membrane-associated phospholipid phosphatase